MFRDGKVRWTFGVFLRVLIENLQFFRARLRLAQRLRIRFLRRLDLFQFHMLIPESWSSFDKDHSKRQFLHSRPRRPRHQTNHLDQEATSRKNRRPYRWNQCFCGPGAEKRTKRCCHR